VTRKGMYPGASKINSQHTLSSPLDPSQTQRVAGSKPLHRPVTNLNLTEKSTGPDVLSEAETIAVGQGAGGAAGGRRRRHFVGGERRRRHSEGGTPKELLRRRHSEGGTPKEALRRSYSEGGTPKELLRRRHSEGGTGFTK
jgi:hypothetical protein